MPGPTLKAFLAALMLTASAPAMAETIEDSLVRQLRDQGFSEFEVTRTLLGRIQIIAISDELRREIVVNPATGEILRDRWESIDGERRPPRLAAPGGGEDDDDDDDDNADDGGDDGDGDGDGGNGGGNGGGTGGGNDGGDDDGDDGDDGDDDEDDDEDDEDDGGDGDD